MRVSRKLKADPRPGGVADLSRGVGEQDEGAGRIALREGLCLVGAVPRAEAGDARVVDAHNCSRVELLQSQDRELGSASHNIIM